MKTSFKIFIFLAVLVTSIFLVQNLVNLPEIGQPPVIIEESQEIRQEIVVSLRFDFGNENIKTYDNTKLTERKTVFDLLKKVTQENNLEFSYKEYSNLGVFIESIDNVANDSKNNKWWQYWVNNEYAQIGASNFILKGGDFIEWKYIKSQF